MRSILSYWWLEPLMVVFLTAICLLYLFINGFAFTKKSIYFFSGFLLLVLSTASPLHFMGEHYLMSAHMLTHVTMLMVAAPLMILGIAQTKHHSFLDSFSEKFAAAPWLAWFAGILVMWFWHIPAIYNGIIDNPDTTAVSTEFHYEWILQDLQSISLILGGGLFWWPIVGPVSSKRMAPLKAVLYLSTACIFCSLLGLMISFAPATVYTGYIHSSDPTGFLHFIRQKGITILIDQQVAGLIMWVPGCLIYLSVSMILLFTWFKGKKENHVFANTQ